MSVGYLIFFGSIVGFSAYIWLLKVADPTMVSTYAYVNPVVAVILGWALAGEQMTIQDGIGATIILLAVIIITKANSRKSSSVSQKKWHLPRLGKMGMEYDQPKFVFGNKDFPGFSFGQQLRFLKLFPLDCLYQIEGNTLYKALRIGECLVLLEITAPEAGELLVRLHQHGRDDIPLDAVRQYVIEWFDLDRDLRSFYEMSRQDELLAPVVEEYPGLHIVGIPNLFEALSWAIIGQQINLTFAYHLKRRFVQAFGEEVNYAGRLYWLFPLPEKVARLGIEDFISMQFSKRKAEYLIGVARVIAEGQLTKAELEVKPTLAEMKQRLICLKGIGAWTADYVLLKCFRQPTAFPVGDAGLQNAVKARLGLSHKPGYDELIRLSLPWRGWEAYATFYLWRTLFHDS